MVSAMIASLTEDEEERFWVAVGAILEERKVALAEGPRTWRELAMRIGLPNETQLSNRRYAGRRAQYRMRPMAVEGAENVTVAGVAAALDVYQHPMTAPALLARAGIE